MSKENTLLIVDDDITSLTALSGMLHTEYVIHEASDGKTAVKIAGEYLPDLILLDIMMPDMDGYQLFSELRNSERTAHIPIIFITGLSSEKDEQKGLEMGAADYIHKPFVDKIVKLRIRHHIQIINQLRAVESLSMIDPLTKIPNRHNFDSRMETEWERAVREKFPVSFLLIDVDYFKKYNDIYGHQQGDKVLCLIAQILTRTLKRQTDFTARWGGEEFAVLLPNTDSKGGTEIGERIRKNIEAAEIPLDDGSFTKVTVSIGIHTHSPKPSCSVGEFFSKTDEALYNAKAAGRNKVCIYSEEAGKMCGNDVTDIDVSDINIPGIDAEAGASLYSDELDIYIAAIKSFSANIPKTLGKMRNVSGETLNQYNIIVHGLKSSCASIGAEDLRERAFDLEMKSRAGDLEGVSALNEGLIKDTEELLTGIDEWLERFN